VVNNATGVMYGAFSGAWGVYQLQCASSNSAGDCSVWQSTAINFFPSNRAFISLTLSSNILFASDGSRTLYWWNIGSSTSGSVVWRTYSTDVQQLVLLPFLVPQTIPAVVDISDVTTHDGCPKLCFAASDNNQAWCCADKFNLTPETCTPACQPYGDSTSCQFLNNPAGVYMDCDCSVYVTGESTNNILRIQADGTMQQVFTGLNHPRDLISCDC
jgi:hypothetical protein